MKILVTGANGFVGKNLVAELKNRGYTNIFEYDVDTGIDLLEAYAKQAQFVFHLAGINRPKNNKEFMEGNFGFTSQLLGLLEKQNNKAPILITSSIKAQLNNPYGESKKAGEDLVFKYGRKHGVDIYVYRLPNLFGKWSRPNYNTVVATFCYNVARGIEIEVSDPNVELTLCYIDDVLEELLRALDSKPTKSGRYCIVPVSYNINLGELADTIKRFKENRDNLKLPDLSNGLTKSLYSTYLSFIPEDDYAYRLIMHSDDRGSFTEVFKSKEQGQISINVTKPGAGKGNHWHHTKIEKFLAVYGEGVIRFRKIGTERVFEYKVNAEKMEVIDIPVGYTHEIINTGKVDMVTLVWVNECFDPERPDTYYEKV